MKTTGVSDIPKFGLLDFLGHPSGEDTQFCKGKENQPLFSFNENYKKKRGTFIKEHFWEKFGKLIR